MINMVSQHLLKLCIQLVYFMFLEDEEEVLLSIGPMLPVSVNNSLLIFLNDVYKFKG